LRESIKRVAQILSKIAAAGGEQSTGIDQVNGALTHLDEATQQNSAPVDKDAAAAKSLEQRSQDMNQQVSVFRLGDSHSAVRARAPVAALRRPAA
jgi:methyl-accepting chemotaxis protein